MGSPSYMPTALRSTTTCNRRAKAGATWSIRQHRASRARRNCTNTPRVYSVNPRWRSSCRCTPNPTVEMHMKEEQLNELLLQALEHEMGGVKIYEAALECA